jgi:GT2 family glycosyltransferase
MYFQSVLLDISIVTFNSAQWLEGFIKSLLKQNLPLAQINLYFRDNGSTDGTVSALQAIQKKYINVFHAIELDEGRNIGFGSGHNANFARCQNQFVLVTNVDLEFEADTLTILLKLAQEDSAQVASWECRQKPYEHPKDYNPVNGETLWSSSACVLFRLSALQQVGLYERALFMYGEDVELSYRLRDHGFKLKYVPLASVWHHTYEDVAQVKPLQFLGSTLANVLLRCRYGSRQEIFQGFVMFLGLFLLRPQFPGQRKKLLAQFFKLLWLTPNFLRTRKLSQQPFPFRLWDYALAREGAFYPFLEKTPAHKPLVSVLVRTMPGFGGRLKEALASIAAQTYARVHLVVVEDGGDTARCTLEAVLATGRFSEVTYIALPQSGRCGAGNAALAAAKGELVCFLDDDDLFYADHLEVLVNSWSENPELGAVYGLAYEVRTEVISQEPWVYKDLVHSLMFRQPFSRSLLWHHNFMPIQTVLFQRKLFEQYGGFDPDLDNLEDWNLWVRYSLKHDFLMVPKVTSLYRVPASVEKALQRQSVLDDYYGKAQAKHAQLKIELSPPEILKMAEQLSKELYIGVIPSSLVRNVFLKTPLINKLYYPVKRIWSLWRAIRSR